MTRAPPGNEDVKLTFIGRCEYRNLARKGSNFNWSFTCAVEAARGAGGMELDDHMIVTAGVTVVAILLKVAT